MRPVYVPLRENDRSMIGQGILNNTLKDENGNLYADYRLRVIPVSDPSLGNTEVLTSCAYSEGINISDDNG
jgi:hypothetical protein